MPLYAIVTCIDERESQHNSCLSTYNLLTTPDQKTADLFYRYFQENAGRIKMLERPSAQMWNYKADKDLRDIVDGINTGLYKFTDDRFTCLRGNIIIQEYDPHGASVNGHGMLPVIPHTDAAVPRHGGEYFIRNSLEQKEYWYLGEDIVICDSYIMGATRFRIELADNANIDTLGQPVLIDSDEVHITAVTPDGDVPISVQESSEWYMGSREGGSSVLRFGALQGGFVADYGAKSLQYYDGDGPAGTIWELVL